MEKNPFLAFKCPDSNFPEEIKVVKFSSNKTATLLL